MTDLLVIGECRPDVMAPGHDAWPGTELPAGGSKAGWQQPAGPLVTGGPGAVTAMAAARLGLRVALVAAVADDPAGHSMLTELAREGVNISGVVIRDEAGGPGAAISTLTAADVPAALLAGARHVHVSSYVLLQRSLGPGLAAMFKAGRAGGTTTSLDASADPAGPWDSGQLNRVLRQCDLLLADAAGALAISGTQEPQDAAAALAAADRGVVIRLAAGAICCSGSQLSQAVPPARPGPAGAGGYFNAGLLAGVLRGLTLPDAMALGCAVSGWPASGQAGPVRPGQAGPGQAGPGRSGRPGPARCPDLPTALELARKVTVRRVP